MLAARSDRTRAMLQALFVTLLWSSSWVLIKIGLEDIPALTFAGLRYALAFVCLLPFALRSAPVAALRRLAPRERRQILALGIWMYAVAQGTQYLALDRLPAVTLSLLLNFTAIGVALLGIRLLGEYPSFQQWGGIGLYLVGVLVYFYPATIPTGQVIGLAFGLLCLFGTSLGTVIGREVNRGGTISPLLVTTVGMGIGAAVMLVGGIASEGVPALDLQSWAIIAWLAVANTAFAFTLWNHTQRTLSAVESNVINNTMLIQIAILAWLFLGESLTAREIAGMGLVAAGTLVVQVRRRVDMD